MEPVVKVEKCDDEEEFQCISVEETQLSEVSLAPKSRTTLKRNYNTMINSPSIVIVGDVTSGTDPSEGDQPVPPKKISITNDSIVLDATHIIYTNPFFKIIHELGPDKDVYIVRCYTCGRLMRSLPKQPPLVLIKHLKSFHPEIAKLYEKYNLNRLRQITNTETSIDSSFAETNTNISQNGISQSETIPGSTPNENFVIEIIDDDVSDNERVVNNELKSDQRVPISDNANVANVSIMHNDNNTENVSTSDYDGNVAGKIDATLKKLGDVINQKLQKFITETGFKELNNKVDELLKSNTKNDSGSSSLIKELKSEVSSLKNECKALRLAVCQTQASKRQLQNELEKIENCLQKRKLLIKNIKISNRQQPQKDVEKLFKDDLNLDNISIVKCSIIPSTKKSKTSAPTESVSVELLQAEDCKLVLRQMHKLKNSGIFIEPELTSSQRKRRNKLMILRKELLSHKSDLKVLVRNTTLVVNGKNFYWDDIEGLYHNEAESIESTGAEYLNTLTGLNLKDFIGFLLKYQMNVKKN